MARRLLRDFTLYLPSQVVPALTGIGSISLLTRILSPRDYGILTLAMATVGAGLVLHQWLLASLARFHPAARDDQGRRGLIAAALCGHAAAALLLGVGALGLGWRAGAEEGGWRALLIAGVAVFWVRGLYDLLMQLLRVRMEARTFTRFSIWESLGGLMLGAGLAQVWGSGAPSVLTGYFLAGALALPLLWRKAMPPLRISDARPLEHLGRMAAFGIPQTASQLGAWALRRVDRYQIQSAYGVMAVGAYSAAYQVAQNSILLAAGALRLSSWPLVATAWEKKGAAAGLRLLDTTTRLYLLIALPMVAGVSALAEPLLRLLAGPGYAVHWRVVPWVAAGALFLGLHQRFVQALSLVLRPAIILLSVALAAAANVTLNWWLLPRHGVEVAGFTTLLSYALLCLTQGIACRIYCPWPFPWRTAWRASLAALAMAAMVTVTRAAVSPAPVWLVLLAAVVVGVITYPLLLLLLGEVSVAEVREQLARGGRGLRGGRGDDGGDGGRSRRDREHGAKLAVAPPGSTLHRLRAMSGREVAWRAGSLARQLLLLPRRSRIGRVPRPTDPRMRRPTLGSTVAAGVPESVRAPVLAIARRWLGHRCDLFERKDVALGDVVDWHRDYSSGRVGPRRPSVFINHRQSRTVGDVRYVWELNRLQHLVPLALAASWSEEERFDAEIEGQLRSWSAQNPFLIGLNWTSPLEAGLRLISLAYVAFLTSGNGRLDRLFGEALAPVLHQHQYFVRWFHSRHSSANNHLIGEMAGLYVAATLWPWFEESREWRSYAKQTLHAAIFEQVEPDGVARERSLEYQLFSIELLMLAAELGARTGDAWSGDYWDRLEAMTGFVAALRDRCGNLPRLGDGDGSQAIALPDSLVERAGALARGARSGGTASPVASLPDLRLWLLRWGATAAATGSAMPPAPPDSSEDAIVTFPQGGYHVLSAGRGRPDELIVVFDAGPLGLGPSFAHGHADALSLWLSCGGEEMLTDPGTFSYFTSPRWRAYFRGTAAHSTIRVDGLDQSVPAGRFLWRRAARARMLSSSKDGDTIEIEASHDGYCRLFDPVVHIRRLRLRGADRSLEVIDRLECQGDHQVELLFQFASRCRLRREEPSGVGANGRASTPAEAGSRFVAESPRCRLEVQLDERLGATVACGSLEPELGWQSPAFGVREPAFTLIGTLETRGPLEIRTMIRATVAAAATQPGEEGVSRTEASPLRTR